MKTRKIISVVTFALVGAGLTAAPAQAADPVAWSYAAATGGTYVKVQDTLVNSDLTAQSGVTGGANSSTSKNSTAAANVAGLLSVGAIETSTSANVNKTAKTTTLSSFARTAKVDLLGGLIRVDAVTTNISTVGRADGTGSHTANTQFAGIKIVGINLPLNIPKNYGVEIPGVASISLNMSIHGKVDRTVGTIGWALGVTLLQPRGGYPAGVTILVNPVNQYLSEVDPSSGAGLSGTAYGTRVEANVSDQIQVISDPTARVGTPYGSSNGKTLTNSTAGVNIPGLLTTGVVSSTTTSTKDAFGNAEITNTNRTAGINLLGGLIKANAIKVTATGKLQDGVWTNSMKMELVNLVIAGKTIPINVSPNTVINVAGLGEVAINLQRVHPGGAYFNRIDGVRITLSTAQAGLPVGAVIELGVASTAISPQVQAP
ncbi:MAG: hypothetical protein NTX33_09985 [Propionibacteriales bacterium]|nr:hypothetical protein [Propionibacteriales bacterium]